MKKVFYILVVILTISLSFSSCTKEEVKPKTENGTAGNPIKE